MIASMDTELHEMARTVDPAVLGARVRDARLAKGLTQTAVAGAEMSTAYVSRIESGQRRPDPELIEVIAARLDLAVDELVMGTTRDKVAEVRLSLLSAEVEIKTGEAGQALQRLDETLMDLAGQGQANLQRETLRLKAAALEAEGRLDEAIILLEDLTTDSEHDTIWLVEMTALCRCYRIAGDLTRAVDSGERAYRLLTTYELGGTREASDLTLSLAAAYFERGETGVAARLCQRAVIKAEGLEAGAKGPIYWAASIMESRQGRHDAAIALARKALAYIEVGEDHRLLATVRSQLGIMQLRAANPEPREALDNLQQAGSELALTEATASVLAANQVAQARAHYFLGESDTAELIAQRAAHTAKASAPLVAADALVLLAQVAMHRGDVEVAKAHYRGAVASLSAVGADRSAAQLWFELGTHFEALGETSQALDAFRRAGVSTGLAPMNSMSEVQVRAQAEQHQRA